MAKKKEKKATAEALRRKSYPSGRKDLPGPTDNLILWINGPSNIHEMMSEEQSKVRSKIDRLERDIRSFSTKTVKGKEYWYQWNDNGWKYMGAADPRIKTRAKIKHLQGQLKGIQKRFESKILKRMGKHAIVDKSQLRPRRYDDTLSISKVIRQVQQLEISGRITPKER